MGPMIMNVSNLRHAIIIEENRGKINDGAGNRIENWVPIATTWAEVRPVTGNEVTIAERRGQELTHNVKIRYRKHIKKDKHRIIFNGRKLEIQYIINKDELNIELNIQCREV